MPVDGGGAGGGDSIEGVRVPSRVYYVPTTALEAFKTVRQLQ